MRGKSFFLLLMVFIVISGCEKNSDKADENNKQTSQNISQSKEEETTKETQESEYSAQKADAILEGMGIKSYDIWSYLRPDTGEETDEFLNKEYEEAVSIAESVGAEYPQTKEKFIEERRKGTIYGRYKIEQQEPLIIKVNCKDNDVYMSEKKWQETAYAYVSPNGYLFKNDEKWYEIQGYKDYKECLWNIWHCLWWYSGDLNETTYEVNIQLHGFDKRDEKSYDEEKIRKQIQEYLYGEKDIPEDTKDIYEYTDGQCTYNCEELTVNAYYRIENNVNTESEYKKAVRIVFYTMLDEHKAIRCDFFCFNIKNDDYYNEITEEMLREIFTVREYK